MTAHVTQNLQVTSSGAVVSSTSIAIVAAASQTLTVSSSNVTTMAQHACTATVPIALSAIRWSARDGGIPYISVNFKSGQMYVEYGKFSRCSKRIDFIKGVNKIHRITILYTTWL